MNEKEYNAFTRTAKRIKDQSQGKMTMSEARKVLANQLEKAARRKEKK